MSKIFLFILCLTIIFSSALLIHANKNETNCKKWCNQNPDICVKCSKWRGCGPGYHKLKSFRGRGKDWFACGNKNKRDCENYCKQNSQCDKCSRFPSCGSGWTRIKKFNKYRGRNWHACKKQTGTSCYRTLLLSARWNGNLHNPGWTTKITSSQVYGFCSGAKIKKISFSCSANNCDGVTATFLKIKIGSNVYTCNTSTLAYSDTNNDGYNEGVKCSRNVLWDISADMPIEVTGNPVITKHHVSAVCDTTKLPSISINLTIDK